MHGCPFDVRRLPRTDTVAKIHPKDRTSKLNFLNLIGGYINVERDFAYPIYLWVSEILPKGSKSRFSAMESHGQFVNFQTLQIDRLRLRKYFYNPCARTDIKSKLVLEISYVQLYSLQSTTITESIR